jgi:hypothetical protein
VDENEGLAVLALVFSTNKKLKDTWSSRFLVSLRPPGVNLECICMSEMDEPQLDHILKPSPDPNSNQPIKGPFGYLSTRISYETDMYGNHITPFHFLWDSVLSKKFVFGQPIL